MYNERIDALRAMLATYESPAALEIESRAKTRLHADEIRGEIAALFEQGYYGSDEKAFIINA